MVNVSSKPQDAIKLLTSVSMETLAERISAQLVELQEKYPNQKINPAWLSRRVGISSAAVSKWMNGGTQSLEGENLLKAAEALEVNPTWLATGRGPKEMRQTFPSGAMKMAIKDVLKALMDEKSINQNELADRTKVPQPTIFRILSGDSKDPRHSTVKLLADFFGVTVAQLRGDEPLGAKTGTHSQLRPIAVWERESDLPNDEYIFLPSLDVKLSAGDGTVVWHVDEKGQKQAFTAKWANRMGIDPACAATMVVSGSSMEPRYQDGDSIVVDYCQRDHVIDGKVYAIALEGEVFIKRMFKEVGGAIRVVSDNQDKIRYPDKFVPSDKLEHLQIIGRVIAVSGGAT